MAVQVSHVGYVGHCSSDCHRVHHRPGIISVSLGDLFRNDLDCDKSRWRKGPTSGTLMLTMVWSTPLASWPVSTECGTFTSLGYSFFMRRVTNIGGTKTPHRQVILVALQAWYFTTIQPVTNKKMFFLLLLGEEVEFDVGGPAAASTEPSEMSSLTEFIRHQATD